MTGVLEDFMSLHNTTTWTFATFDSLLTDRGQPPDDFHQHIVDGFRSKSQLEFEVMQHFDVEGGACLVVCFRHFSDQDLIIRI